MAKVATQVSPRTLASRRNGALGGKARAAKHSKAKMKAWSSKGGTSTLNRYGTEFFADAVSRTKTVGRYKTPRAK